MNVFAIHQAFLFQLKGRDKMIYSDLEADCDKCKNCRRLLCKHIAGKWTRELLREWDDDVVFATMVDVRCGYCGEINTIFYQADMLPTISVPRRGRFAWAPTM